MNLFDLVAKLTLDTKEYEKAIDEAEREGRGIQDVEATLDLNTSPFEAGIAEAENADVDDPEAPELGLDKDEFDNVVKEAEGTDVDDPADPYLGLDKSDFDATVEEAEETDVDDPEAPSLGLDTSPYNEALDQAKADTESWSGIVGDIFTELRGVVVTAGVTAAVSGIVSSLSEAVNLARSLGDNVDKSSRAMSISTDAYQEWSHVLDINGASITDLNRGLMNMRKMMGGGEPTKEFTEAMVKLGLATEDAEGNITSQFSSTEDMLKSAMKALADFDTSTEQKLAERDYLAQAIFGRGGTKLNAMFDGTSKDIDDLIQQAHDLGLVMTEEEVANAATYNDAVTNMKASIEAFKTSIVTSLLPELTNVANTIAKIVAFFNPRTKQETLSEMFAQDDAEFSEELLTIEATSKSAETLAEKLLAMGDTSKMTAEQYAIWEGTARELINLVPSLGEEIDIETGKIKGNSQSIKDNIKEWENLAKQKALQALKEEKYAAIVQKNQDLIDKTIEANTKAAKAEEARVRAYHDFSNEMENRGLGSLDFSEGAEDLDKQISAVMNSLAELGDEGEADAVALGAAMKKLGEASTAAGQARKEAEDLAAELEKGKQEYEEWVATAEAMYGTASESAEAATSDVEMLNQAIEALPSDKTINIGVRSNFSQAAHHAKGAWDIPYDNYPALLHRDEMVLTASQARRYKEGQGGEVSYDKIAEVVAVAVSDAVGKVNVLMSGEKVGDLTTRRVKNNINASSYSRLRAMGG